MQRFRNHCWLLVLLLGTGAWQSADPLKDQVIQSVEAQETQLIEMSDQIWAFAETALEETQSAKVFTDYAEAQGFKVERATAQRHAG